QVPGPVCHASNYKIAEHKLARADRTAEVVTIGNVEADTNRDRCAADAAVYSDDPKAVGPEATAARSFKEGPAALGRSGYDLRHLPDHSQQRLRLKDGGLVLLSSPASDLARLCMGRGDVLLAVLIE